MERFFCGELNSGSPVKCPSSPVSRGQHSCGSLFAKCAEHGRWELLQTFTDRGSHLSQKTFSGDQSPQEERMFTLNTNMAHRKSEEIDSCRYRKAECEIRKPLTITPWAPNERISGILIHRSNKKTSRNRVKFASVSEFQEGSNNGNEITSWKPPRPVVIKRHNSVPFLNGSFSDDTGKLYEKKPIFEKSINNQLKTVDKGKVFLKNQNNTLEVPNANDFDERQFLRNLAECNGLYSLRRSCNRNPVQTASFSREKNVNVEKENFDHKIRTPFNGSFINNNSKDFQLNCEGVCPRYGHRSAMARIKKATEFERQADILQTEILLLRRELKKKDQENVRLQSEINKLKSVLQEMSIFKHEGDLLLSLNDAHGMPGQIRQVVNIPNPNKKQGVSGESSHHGDDHHQIEIQRFEKDFRSKQFIKDAIMENNFLKNLDMSQVREIVESVYPRKFSKGDYVVREGEAGSHLYVSAEGEFEVIKAEKVLGKMGPGKAFGELAILYNCRRTASIKVVSDAKVWVLDRQVFQKIMMKTGLQRLQEKLDFLRSVPLLKPLNTEVLAKIADVLEVDFYPSGEHIIRQGATGDTFFIISSGRVKVTQEKVGQEKEKEIRILQKGDYFGEQALLKEDWRTANVIALSPGVECLTLDRESFIQLIGDLSELQEKNYGDEEKGIARPSSSSSLSDKQEYEYIRLQDLDVISTLGVGGFGRVELVQYSKNRSMTFALKCLKKQHIVETKQQEHVYSERNIMMSCNSSFICRLYRTFRDSKYVYMLQEALLGGEVWTILREKGCFDDNTTKFVTGCVIEAFEYLHTRGIIYRDLKPENLLLDSKGYIKLVDFGFSKRIGFSLKTWTFCGTPEYLAPEIILNKGHDRAVDYWSLGILMHELLTGIPPFTAPDPMRTYIFILKGIDMIDFPKHVTKGAQSLIKRLCRDSPSERLGYQRGGIQDIKKHKWYQGFDWEGLKQRNLVPPVSPSIISPTDTSNFDSYSKDSAVPPDEFSNWDAEF